jgi:hypothetical protein
MRISDAKIVHEDGGFSLLEIRKNPSNTAQYIVLLHKHDGKSFILANEDNTVLASPDLGHIVAVLKDIGFKKAGLFF